MEPLSFLVDAKHEYMYQLCKVMCPVMSETYKDLFRDVQSVNKQDKVYMRFQQRLRDINNWNQHNIYANTQALLQKCSWLPELVSAVFVSFIKILSSIRMSNTNKQPTFTMPSTEVFVHACFVAGAKELYTNPFLFRDVTADKIDNTLFNLCHDAIENTVKDMIPVQQILAVYMQKNCHRDNMPVGDFDEEADVADVNVHQDDVATNERSSREDNNSLSSSGELEEKTSRIPFEPYDQQEDQEVHTTGEPKTIPVSATD